MRAFNDILEYKYANLQHKITKSFCDGANQGGKIVLFF